MDHLLSKLFPDILSGVLSKVSVLRLRGKTQSFLPLSRYSFDFHLFFVHKNFVNRKSILYRHPFIYLLGLKLLHGNHFDNRYKYMASFVGKNDVVLEPACGPAVFADFLKNKTSYQGFDTNEIFVKYASGKNKKVKIGNVLDNKNYFKADIVVTCDILHHLKPQDRGEFIKYCYSNAKKVFIICEPIGEKSIKREGLLYFFKKQVCEYLEKDGTNDVKIEYFFTGNELMENIGDGFGVIPGSIYRTTKNFGIDLVAVFFKKGSQSKIDL